jgi:hypothetical protein
MTGHNPARKPAPQAEPILQELLAGKLQREDIECAVRYGALTWKGESRAHPGKT